MASLGDTASPANAMTVESSVEKRKRCFVIGPIGKEGSPERDGANWVLQYILKPVLEHPPFNYDVKRADDFAEPGLITAQVITWLIDADLVIADLTGHNPNAFYELGIRHMVEKPVIHMSKDVEDLPFDIKDHRALPYSLRAPQDIDNAKRALGEQLRTISTPYFRVSNPVMAARAPHPERLSTSIKDNTAILLKALDTLYTPIATVSTRAAKLRSETATPPTQTLEVVNLPHQDDSNWNWNWNWMCSVLASTISDSVLPHVNSFMGKKEIITGVFNALTLAGFEDHNAQTIRGLFNALFAALLTASNNFSAFCEIARSFGPPFDPKQSRDTAGDFRIYLRKIEEDTDSLRLCIFECKESILGALCELCGI